MELERLGRCSFFFVTFELWCFYCPNVTIWGDFGLNCYKFCSNIPRLRFLFLLLGIYEHIQATNSPIYENAIAITQTPSMGCFPDYVGLHIVGTVVRIVSIRVLCRRRYVLSSIDNVVDEIEERV